MKKRSRLLFVVSIILIVLSVLSLLGSVLTFVFSGIVEQSYEMLGMETPPMIYNVLGLLVGIVDLAAGILGVMYRSRKSVLAAGTVYCIAVLANIAASVAYTGFSATYVLNLILPALYMWGWYQSE